MRVWIVGKVYRPNYKEWEFQGVFGEESLAVAACEDETFFVGPAELNEVIGAASVEWVGAYYPKAAVEGLGGGGRDG